VNRPRAQRIADQVHFDITRFSYDVDRALIREDTTIRGLAATINVSLSALLKFFRGEGGISLDTAAALAEWADLRLDDYVKGRTTAGGTTTTLVSPAPSFGATGEHPYHWADGPSDCTFCQSVDDDERAPARVMRCGGDHRHESGNVQWVDGAEWNVGEWIDEDNSEPGGGRYECIHCGKRLTKS
jgi:hypothetical protein